MPFRLPNFLHGFWEAYPLRVAVLAAGWLILITVLHFTLNMERDQRPTVNMGYMPVITNLAAPLLDAASAGDEAPVRFRAIKFAAFAEMAEALRNGHIQAAFIIAPLSIVLHQQGEDVRIVYIGNRHESTFVVRTDLAARSIADLGGCTIAVPMRFSGHNLAALKMMREAGSVPGLRIVEMNPPDMASALAAGSLDGYLVGEPFAAQSLKSGSGRLLTYLEDVWPGFICNLLLVRQQLIDEQPHLVNALVQSAIRSGIWARDHLDQAGQIASRYWGQPADLVEYALNTPSGRLVFDQYLPSQEEMQELADTMKTFGLIEKADIEGLVDADFARRANLSGIDTLDDILK
ncbi:MAG: ABC transporter substrate-binding protein [Desulfatitalea sp.]|nr:ABC transporter substrate-binding protein [Desulfatitalea sp.]